MAGNSHVRQGIHMNVAADDRPPRSAITAWPPRELGDHHQSAGSSWARRRRSGEPQVRGTALASLPPAVTSAPPAPPPRRRRPAAAPRRALEVVTSVDADRGASSGRWRRRAGAIRAPPPPGPGRGRRRRALELPRALEVAAGRAGDAGAERSPAARVSAIGDQPRVVHRGFV